MAKRSPAPKDIGLLHQLHQGGQLKLRPEFQRDSVWPQAAKAYLIDTILNDRPMPLFFFERTRSLQTGLTTYSVIDGQQRLRAIFDFLDDRFSLTQSGSKGFKGKKFSSLSKRAQNEVLNYALNVEELTGYAESEIRDIFVRMNKYVVKLSPQELRHARHSGKFYEYSERLAKWPFWKDAKVFTALQRRRMRAVEFSAELTILLAEGPQDKKRAIDLYYGQYQKKFPGATDLEARLHSYLSWIKLALPDIKRSRYRKPTDLYGLVGAIDVMTRAGRHLKRLNAKEVGERLRRFERDLLSKRPSGAARTYIGAASRQTDNIGPRTDRIEVLSEVMSGRA
jgi:hypothetical protein